MSKEMIISSSAHETRVAILEDDQVAEIFIERERSRGVVGNVYKGRVSKVLPGMQSAFVDLGLERDGFLYVTDVVASLEELDRFETEDEDVSAAPAGQAGGNGGSTAGQRRDRPSSHGGRGRSPSCEIWWWIGARWIGSFRQEGTSVLRRVAPRMRTRF